MTTAAEPIADQTKVGSILRQLREKKNLTIEEVAGQMRLDPRLIGALEADNYKIFAADTYIRGYLRNYSKLLGVNGDEIIALYQSEAPAPPEIIPDVKHPTQVSSSDKPVKAFSYLITFILVLLLFIWWRQSDFSFSRSLGINEAAQPVVNNTATEPIAAPTAGTAAIPDTVPPAAEATGIAAATPPTKLESATPTAATAIPPVPATAAPAGNDNSAMSGPDTIYLKLNADCWIDIRDQFGKDVYHDLARTGEELHLSGFAPFKVELGNAQGVMVVFNNKPYDPAPVTTKGIARFSLGD